ncbi:MAG: hypothetical protein AB4426_34365 [Xenococcaceae cyanobacterium]
MTFECVTFDLGAAALATVEEDDVWIADRNFCTLNFLSGNEPWLRL